MIEALITGLIYLCLLALAVILVIWVLQQIGVALPDQVQKIIWVIVLLVGILIIMRTVLPPLGIRLL